MKRTFLFFALAQLICVHTIFATDIAGGNVSGTWTKANSPYTVKGDITIGANDKLIIQPGVQVIFDGHYKLQVFGVLYAVGTKADSITFKASNTATGWGGIRFDNSVTGANGAMTSNDSSFISFCHLESGIVKTTWPDNSGGAIFGSGFEQLKITNCLFMNNESTKGGAIYIENGGFVDSCMFINNICGGNGSGGAFYVKTLGSAQNSTFIGNKAYYGGAVLITASGGTADGFASIVNCKMYDNEATEGGAIRSYKGTMINCIAANNKATQGGGIRVEQTKVINSTIVNNKGTSGNYLLKENTVVNSIIWGNNASSDNNQITTSDTTMVVKYCGVQGGYTGPGAKGGILNLAAGNSQAKFKAPTAFDGKSSNATQLNDVLNADWQLEQGSVCVDAGENFSFPPNLSGDINGSDRVYNNTIDLGAYEYKPAPDTTDTTTHAGSIHIQKSVNVYPSIASHTVNVENHSGKVLNMVIYNTTGALLHKTAIPENGNKVDISAYPAGMLYIRLSSDNESSVYRVVKY